MPTWKTWLPGPPWRDHAFAWAVTVRSLLTGTPVGLLLSFQRVGGNRPMIMRDNSPGGLAEAIHWGDNLLYAKKDPHRETIEYE